MTFCVNVTFLMGVISVSDLERMADLPIVDNNLSRPSG